MPIIVGRARRVKNHSVRVVRENRCPACRGKGVVWLEGDAHRSSGWIPCNNREIVERRDGRFTIKYQCIGGVLR